MILVDSFTLTGTSTLLLAHAQLIVHFHAWFAQVYDRYN